MSNDFTNMDETSRVVAARIPLTELELIIWNNMIVRKSGGIALPLSALISYEVWKMLPVIPLQLVSAAAEINGDAAPGI